MRFTPSADGAVQSADAWNLPLSVLGARDVRNGRPALPFIVKVGGGRGGEGTVRAR